MHYHPQLDTINSSISIALCGGSLMKRFTLTTLSLLLAVSLCPTLGFAAGNEAATLNQNNDATPMRSGIVENVTVATDNFLGANFDQEPDDVADSILSAYARKELSQGRNVNIWLESTRTVSDEDAALIQKNLGGYLPIANFSLTPYSQVEDEAPVNEGAVTRGDALVRIGLKLPDSLANTDPTIVRDYKILCVYEGNITLLPCTYDADSNTLIFRTNRFASFGLICQDTRDGKTVYPVLVRNSYAQQNGQGQYAAGDKVTIYAGNRKGYLVDMWSASPQDKVRFTYNDSDRVEFIMPDTPVVISATWIKIGDINDVTNASDNALNTTLVDTDASLAKKVLDQDAMDLVIGGVSTDIWLNSNQEIPEADKKVITHALGDWSLAEEIDLTLFYEIDGKETQVHKTNGPITVKIALPDSPDISLARTYKVIRVHEGKADVLPATFNTNTHELTFETDRFSAYAVVYKEVKDGSELGVSNTPSTPGTNDGDNPSTTTLAATGDASLALFALLGAFIAASCLMYSSIRRSRLELKERQ